MHSCAFICLLILDILEVTVFKLILHSFKMPLSRTGSTDETANSLNKYREAFVRNFQQLFTQFGAEEQRTEAANQLFDTIKTPSELAKIAITLKLITIQQLSTKDESKSEKATLQRTDSIDIREKPAQNKISKEIESINQRIQGLYDLRKLRELTPIEQNEVRNALSEREELRKRLKKTQDAAIRAKRYRVRKATLMSTDSDIGNITGEPAFKFSRSLSVNVLTSDEDSQFPYKDRLFDRTTGIGGFFRENSVCLTVTPTSELGQLNISPALSTSSIKTEDISPTPEVITLVSVNATPRRKLNFK